MSASTIDRRLGPLKRAAMPRGMSLTRPAGEHLRNSVRIRKCTDEIARLPGLAEADTVAHCGPSARGEFARTLTMADYATNRAADVTARNNAKSNIRKAVDLAIPLFPFPVTCFDSDNGTESINDELIDRLQHKDIEQTRSRPYRKNDQATVESRNNHVVRKFAFYWRYDTEEQRDLPDRLWAKTYLLLNLFTPTRKPARIEQGRDGRRRTVYDRPRTPWARVLEYDAASRADGGRGYVDDATRTRIENLIASTNPARLGRGSPPSRTNSNGSAANAPKAWRADRAWTWDTWERRSNACTPTPNKTTNRNASTVSRSPSMTNEQRFRAHLFMTNLGTRKSGRNDDDDE